MEYKQQYGYLRDLVETQFQKVSTKDITDDNVDEWFDNVINILCDGIETEYVQRMKVRITFADDVQVSLTIMDFMFNLLLWPLITCSGRPIESKNLYFEDAITRISIKRYIDKNFIRTSLKLFPIITLNQLIDRSIGKFRKLENFQMYLANSLNLYDTIVLMRQYPEFNDTIHFDPSGIPLEDVKEKGMEAMRIQNNYIKNSDHCLRDALSVGEGVNPKQEKEVYVNIGPKPNGLGSVFPHAIQRSFINGGLQTIEDVVMDSSVGRLAQLIKKQNVGDSGSFARKLGLNGMDTIMHPDPEYSCDTKNHQEVVIKNSDMLDMFNMRYYKFNPKGVLHLLDSVKDKHLIGQKLYFRSPMTCASAARGEGICYKCYGDLAYVNSEINIGQIAAEFLSAIYTQKQLSAKHLLEAAIVKMEWEGPFHDLFTVQFNLLELKDGMKFKGMKLIIDSDEIVEDERDQDESMILTGSRTYITQFQVMFPDGSVVDIRTSTGDELYIHTDLMYYMTLVGVDDDGMYVVDMSKLKDLALFEIDVKNDELSKTMKIIHSIINNKATTKGFERNSILEAFIDNNLMGGIKLNSVHFEVILMNQMRHIDDILLLPDWRHENEPCQIVTLDHSLNYNRSISIRLQSSGVAKSITSPDNHKLTQPSVVDLFAMEKPQEFMSGQIPLSDYVPIGEEGRNIESPIFFYTREEEEDVETEV